MKRPIVHSDALAERIRSGYSLDEITMLRSFLVERGTFLFHPIGNGLYPSFDQNGLDAAEVVADRDLIPQPLGPTRDFAMQGGRGRRRRGRRRRSDLG